MKNFADLVEIQIMQIFIYIKLKKTTLNQIPKKLEREMMDIEEDIKNKEEYLKKFKNLFEEEDNNEELENIEKSVFNRYYLMKNFLEQLHMMMIKEEEGPSIRMHIRTVLNHQLISDLHNFVSSKNVKEELFKDFCQVMAIDPVCVEDVTTIGDFLIQYVRVLPSHSFIEVLTDISVLDIATFNKMLDDNNRSSSSRNNADGDGKSEQKLVDNIYTACYFHVRSLALSSYTPYDSQDSQKAVSFPAPYDGQNPQQKIDDGVSLVAPPSPEDFWNLIFHYPIREVVFDSFLTKDDLRRLFQTLVTSLEATLGLNRNVYSVDVLISIISMKTR